ncbi:MAG: hypothetical protein LBK76_10180 [Verrucomicrobiales bacterium]|jgi:hypothetical protein|nr:hypothetical protein [Verrucomicrobiales bacterium]
MNRNLQKLSVLIRVICGLTSLPLTVSAQQQYLASGTKLVLTGTYTTSTDGAAGYGFYVRGGTMTVQNDVTMITTGSAAQGLRVQNVSDAVLFGGDNLKIITQGFSSNGIYIFGATSHAGEQCSNHGQPAYYCHGS